MELEAAAILPTDAEQACLIGRVWNPEVSGPCVVVYRDGDLLDITPSFPTVRDLQEQTDPAAGYETASKIFEKLKTLNSNKENIYWDTLSMGMSKDFEQAIQSGSNTIRLGTNLFGPRGN